MKYYLFLAIAIASELIATTFLKYSTGFTKLVPSVISIIAYVICFFFFSKSLININLSIAYATWSAVGLIVTTIISTVIFNQSITLVGVIGIVLITVGVIILNLFGALTN